MDLEAIKIDLQKTLSEKRFNHTLSVMETAKDFAKSLDASPWQLNQSDKTKLELAACLHDCCKEVPNAEMLQLAEHYGIAIYDEDRNSPNLLHARVGAAYVEDKYDIYDPLVLDAIREHTLAAPAMSNISKLLYLADMLEAKRDAKEKASNPGIETELDRLRSIIHVEKDLDAALLAAINSSFEYLVRKRLALHPLGVAARNALLENLKSR